MLSQDDRRQLEAIERHLELTDPGFALALCAGVPRRPRGTSRWPLYLAMVLTGLLFLAGLLTQIIWLMIVGAVAWCAAAAAFQLKVRRSQGPRIRRYRGGRGSR